MIAGARRLVMALSIVAAVAGCGSATGPSGSVPAAASPPASHLPGPPGLDWTTADVERPAGMDAAPPSISPVDGQGNGLGHPGHFAGQGNPYDLAAVGSRLVAVGYTFPDFHAVTWTTTDRHAWALADLAPGTDDAFATAIAAGLASGPTAGRAAIVGHIGNVAAAWWSEDGTTWSSATGGTAFAGPQATTMTSVIAGAGGFVAGGWAGITNQPGSARFWGSTDGRSWTRLPVDDERDGRVTAIAGGPAGFVAVGTTGPVGHATGSAVWTSRDGAAWHRLPDTAPLAAGQMLSVTAGGPGFVAVGANLTPDVAVVWRSTDGTAWKLAPAQASLTYNGLGITMADVTSGPHGALVAVGHFLFGTQYGQGTAWVSEDGGASWTRMPDEAVFGQGEPQAVIADGPGYVATGTVGAPDNYIPTVWLSPSNR